jgi:hypothetical protein
MRTAELKDSGELRRVVFGSIFPNYFRVPNFQLESPENCFCLKSLSENLQNRFLNPVKQGSRTSGNRFSDKF